MSSHTSIDSLQTALRSLVPAAAAFGVRQVGVAEESFDYAAEGAHLTQAVVGRRNEFIEGRRCARQALADLGHASVALPADENGLPRWPEGMLGSISHSRGLCCAVAASAEGLACLGVDIEKTNRLSVRAMARVVHPAESDFVGEDQARGSLLFSVKEAFFKAQFPVWGAQPNFHDLVLAVDAECGEMAVADVANDLPLALREAVRSMRFRYHFFDDYVVTVCWLPRT